MRFCISNFSSFFCKKRYAAVKNYVFAVSIITKFEIYSGSIENQLPFWDTIFSTLEVVSFDEISLT